MWEYIVILLLTIGGIIAFDIPSDKGCLQRKGSQISGNIVYWTLIALLTLTAGLRYRNGIDTMMYQMFWAASADYQASSGLWDIVENRQMPLFSLMRNIGMEYWQFQLLCATLLNVAIGLFVKRYTLRRFTAIFFYLLLAYINLNFEVMREGCAIAIFLWAYRDFEEGDWKRYYLKALLAMMIHFSAILLLLLPLLKVKRIWKLFSLNKNFLILCVVSAFLAWSGMYLLEYLFQAGGEDDAPPLLAALSNFIFKCRSSGIINSPGLNWKGVIGHGVRFVAYPIFVAWQLLKRSQLSADGGVRNTETCADAVLERIVALMALLGLLSIFCNFFRRLENYLVIPYIIAIVRTFPLKDICFGDCGKFARLKEKFAARMTIWWLVFIPLLALNVYGYFAPVAHTRNTRTYELYIPYTNWIKRQPNDRFCYIYQYYVLRDCPEEAEVDEKHVDAFEYLHKYCPSKSLNEKYEEYEKARK